MVKKEDWLYNGASYDISFCISDCKNEQCRRNVNNKFFKNMPRDGWYSASTFCEICTSYIPSKDKEEEHE